MSLFELCCLMTCVAGLILLSAFGLDNATCRSQAKVMVVEHSYGPLQGCMVKVNGRWLPLKAVREVNP